MSEDRYHFGVVGHKISYTLSPELFSILAEETKVEIEYSVFDCSSEGLPAIIDELKKLDGFSVTIPHERQIIPLLDFSSYEARQIGAVNSVRVRDGSLFGFNTDTAGFIYPLRQPKSDLKNILVLGYGGAARAVVWALLKEYPQADIVVCGRDPEKAVRFAGEMREFGDLAALRGMSMDGIEDDSRYDLIINCTPLGGVEYPDQSPLPESFGYAGKPVNYDLVYKPRQTLFLREAEKNGCRTLNGISMLVMQALTSYIVWTDRKIDMDGVGQTIRRKLSTSEELQ